MKHMRIFAILCGAFLALACVSQPEVRAGNALILTNPNNLYPNENYLIAVGTGDTRKAAENQALASLAQIFESEIIVDTQTRQTYRSVLSGLADSELESEVTQNISVNTDHSLINVRYSEAYRDEDNRFHIVAYMDRDETGRIYRDIIQTNNARVNKTILDADETSGLIKKYSLVQEAMGISLANEILMEQIRIISPRLGRISRPDISYADIESLNRNLLSQLIFSVAIDGDNGALASHVAEELAHFGFATADSGNVKVSGALVFENGGASEEYETVLWNLNLSVVDSDGVLLFTINETNRERALDRVTAEFLAQETIKEIISDIITDSLLSVL